MSPHGRYRSHCSVRATQRCCTHEKASKPHMSCTKTRPKSWPSATISSLVACCCFLPIILTKSPSKRSFSSPQPNCCSDLSSYLDTQDDSAVMAWAVRSLRRLQSAAASASHAARSLESRSWIRVSRNADVCVDRQHFILKRNSLETVWEVHGASLRALSTMTSTTHGDPSATHEEASSAHEEVSREGSGDDTVSLTSNKGSPRVVFILGGPGSGKGTQCQKIVDKFGFVHLSAGDLLRAEIQSGSKYGDMIKNMIKDGKIVPSEVTVRLLLKAMEKSKGGKFLIDGFPRNDENRAVFERMTGIVPDFILFFDCPEAEMERRVLGRNQGRVDDNKETMQKRLKVFVDFSVPVVKYYESMGKVHKVSATGSIDDIHTTIEPLFEQFLEEADSTGEPQFSTGKFDRSRTNN